MTPPGVDTVLVIAKRPVPGRVKTRLVPPYDHDAAAELAAACLTDTLAAVDAFAPRQRILLFDGDVTGWQRAGWQHVPQAGGGLDERLADGFDAAASLGAGATLVVGMDTPQVTPRLLARFDPTRFDACLGRTRDGGYWTIGFRDPARARENLVGVPMSTDVTAHRQLRRLRANGLRVQRLHRLIDIDTAVDAAAVARALRAPSAFGAAHRRLAVG